MSQVRYVLLVITLVSLVGVSALALNVPNAFVSGDVISAAEMNANFAAVEAAVTALEAQAAEAQASLPIVAHGRVATPSVIITTVNAAVDVVTVTLVAPAAGVVLVQATAQAGLFGSVDSNLMVFQIDTDEGGFLDGNAAHEFIVGSGAPANVSTVYSPVAIQRAFEVGSGTHTFRLEATGLDANGTKYMWDPTITATWYPEGRSDVQVPVATLSGPGGGNRR